MGLLSIDFGKALGQVLPTVCGIPDSVLSGISARYIVKITANYGQSLATQGLGQLDKSMAPQQQEFVVNGYLQDKIAMTASSKWEGLTQAIPGMQFIEGALDTASQALSGTSTRTPLTTRRKWAGSDPIGMSMKLKFEAFEDAYSEVIMPCIGLQGLTLPRGGVGNTFFLTPPGPNPFNIKLKSGVELERNESITIDIGGGFLKFDSVIIKSVKVVFENRMTERGPVGAEADIDFETYQMLTREDLMKIVNNNRIPEMTGTLGTPAQSATPVKMSGGASGGW